MEDTPKNEGKKANHPRRKAALCGGVIALFAAIAGVVYAATWAVYNVESINFHTTGTSFVTMDATDATAVNNLGTISSQDADSVNIDGGAIDGTIIGGSVRSSGNFTTLDASDVATIGADDGTPSGNTALFVQTLADPEIRLVDNTSPEYARIQLIGDDNELHFEVHGSGEGSLMVFDDHGTMTAKNVTGNSRLNAAGVISITPSDTPDSITSAGTTIDPDGKSYVEIDPNASYTMTSTPTIQNSSAYNGQLAFISNVDAAFTVTLQDNGTLANSDLSLFDATVDVLPGTSVGFIYSTTLGQWQQIGGPVHTVDILSVLGTLTLGESSLNSDPIFNARGKSDAFDSDHVFCTTQGDGGVVGPQAAVSSDGYAFDSMMKIQKNGSDAYIPVYTLVNP